METAEGPLVRPRWKVSLSLPQMSLQAGVTLLVRSIEARPPIEGLMGRLLGLRDPRKDCLSG